MKVNLFPTGKRIATYKFYIARKFISIAMKFITEVGNYGVTISLLE